MLKTSPPTTDNSERQKAALLIARLHRKYSYTNSVAFRLVTQQGIDTESIGLTIPTLLEAIQKTSKCISLEATTDIMHLERAACTLGVWNTILFQQEQAHYMQ